MSCPQVRWQVKTGWLSDSGTLEEYLLMYDTPRWRLDGFELGNSMWILSIHLHICSSPLKGAVCKICPDMSIINRYQERTFKYLKKIKSLQLQTIYSHFFRLTEPASNFCFCITESSSVLHRKCLLSVCIFPKDPLENHNDAGCLHFHPYRDGTFCSWDHRIVIYVGDKLSDCSHCC